MEQKFQHLAFVLGPIILAGFVVTRLIKYEYVNHDNDNDKLQMAKNAESVAAVLLFLVVLKVVKENTIDGLWVTFTIGFITPLVVYSVVSILSNLTCFHGVVKVEGVLNKLLISSFGGGNRGNLLVLSAFGGGLGVVGGVGGSSAEDIIKNFIILDLGNLVCLITFGFLRLAFVADEKLNISLSDIVEKLLKNPGTWAILLIILQLPQLKETGLHNVISFFDPLLKGIGIVLGPLFSFFVFLSIFLRIDKVTEVLNNTMDVTILFLSSRILSILALCGFLLIFETNLAVVVAVSILLLMPPSSFLWARLSKSSPDILSSSKRSSVYLVPNFLYFVLLAIGILWGLVYHP